MSIVKIILRIGEIMTNPFYRLIALFSSRRSIPKVRNPILITSASELAKKIRSRELTCEEVVSAFIERCKEVNPIVNAIIQDRFRDALEDARKADDFLLTTTKSVIEIENEKPLLGIPITIKESCSVKGMMFSLGVESYKKHKAAYNGDAVQLLLDAGAIPIAITSTPPYCSWIETFNSIIGYTSNPYDTRKSTGGSSGGEAALIASAASVLGLGSDAGGSIRIPAAFCGIYGHKTSNRMVSVKGHGTFFSSPEILNMITVGPLCRYAVDLELVMNVLSAGKMKRTSLFTTVHMQRINIFYLLEYKQNIFAVDPIIKKKILEAVAFFKEKNDCQTEAIKISEFNDIFDITFSHVQRLCNLICQEKSTHEWNAQKWKNFINIIHHNPLKFIWKLDEKTFMKKKSDFEENLLNLLSTNGVLLLPTWSESAFYKYQGIFKLYNTCYLYFINVLGLTSTAVPIGFDNDNMPLSIQVIAAPDQDHLCLAVAKELEKLYGGYIPPYDLP